MSTVNRSIVAGVFTDESQAQQAMADLQNAGFTDDQIRYSVHKGGAGILDALTGLGLPQDQANYYNSEFMSGRTVVTVNAGDRQQEAYNILMRNGAYDWNSRTGQTASAGSYTQTAQTDYGSNYTQTPTTEGEQRVRLREEQLQAQKQQVQSGEVGIHKDVVTEEKTLNVPVNREEVYIERKPASGTVAADTPIGEEETYRVPVREEQVQVTKQPVVTEEVGIGKRVVQDNQQVTDTVKREQARINQTGDVNVEGTPVDDTTNQ